MESFNQTEISLSFGLFLWLFAHYSSAIIQGFGTRFHQFLSTVLSFQCIGFSVGNFNS